MIDLEGTIAVDGEPQARVEAKAIGAARVSDPMWAAS